jgi:signal transduction histidine kinase
MKWWLGGKGRALIAFLIIAGLVIGGLGWVTAAVLRLETDQVRSRADAELAGKLRIALWQLDSFILPDLSREDGRPFSHYQANSVTGPGEESLLARSKPPDWILLHFQWDDKGWHSPQLAGPGERKSAPTEASDPDRGKDGRRRRILAELGGLKDLKAMLARLHERGPQPLFNDNSVFVTAPSENQRGSQAAFTDFEKRLNRQSQVRNASVPKPIAAPRPVAIKLGRPMMPIWVTAADQTDRLLLAREAQMGARQIVQGVVVDWPRLQAVLAEQIADLFPAARFVPLREGVAPNPERTLAALPIELDPGAAPTLGAVHAWTPLRIGLAVAWAAVGIALLATFLGGWSLIDLSERRSRFVSAVTHELRTPLTTLRLYLDMLTSGMVQDETQKAEYLATLHLEAERLNRLISNVLDFSRLEKQTPRLEMRPEAVPDLLEQARSTWQARCQDAGKELVIENAAGPDATLVTDGQVVLQILGNLIDNACKYSREARDPRICLRARLEPPHLTLVVEDHGPGIPAAERRLIFSPFRRGRTADVTAGGVGLGLALGRRWARLLGGQLTLETTSPHQGAIFRLALPLSASKITG